MDNFNLQLFGDDPSPTYTTTTNLQTVTYSTVVTLVGEPAQFGILDKFYLDNMRAALPQDSVTGAINLKQATNQKYQITGAVTGFFEVGGDSASSVTIHAAVGDHLTEYIDEQLESKLDKSEFEDYILGINGAIDDKLDSSVFDEYKTEIDSAFDDKLNNSDFDEYKTEIDSALDDKLNNSDFNEYKDSVDDDILNLKSGVATIQRIADGSIVFKDYLGVGLFTIASSSSYTVQSGN